MKITNESIWNSKDIEAVVRACVFHVNPPRLPEWIHIYGDGPSQSRSFCDPFPYGSDPPSGFSVYIPGWVDQNALRVLANGREVSPPTYCGFLSVVCSALLKWLPASDQRAGSFFHFAEVPDFADLPVRRARLGAVLS